jgi:hypothetical protein
MSMTDFELDSEQRTVIESTAKYMKVVSKLLMALGVLTVFTALVSGFNLVNAGVYLYLGFLTGKVGDRMQLVVDRPRNNMPLLTDAFRELARLFKTQKVLLILQIVFVVLSVLGILGGMGLMLGAAGVR